VLPRQEVVRLGQSPFLGFANSTLSAVDLTQGEHRAVLFARFLGLFGPNGPLPLHLTEYAFARLHNADDATLSRFLDIFHHRALSLFYRAWADAHPAMQASRRDEDRFGRYLGSFVGTSPGGEHPEDAFPLDAKRRLAGLLSRQRRDEESLQRMLTAHFGVPVSTRSFQGAWATTSADSWSRLGGADGNCRLGVSTVPGTRVWLAQHKFRLVLGPLGMREFLRFLPGARSLAALTALVRHYTGDEFEWDLQLLLRAAEVPATRLGRQGRLGLTSWLGNRDGTEDCGDVVFSPGLDEQSMPAAPITLT
jgi:type VI secretion system protein ImpH